MPDRNHPVFHSFFHRNWKALLFWFVLIVFVGIGWRMHWRGEIIAAAAVLWGLVTQIFAAAFALLAAWVGAVPLVGPIIVKVLTWPLFVLINGLAFFTSLIGFNIGKGRKVFEARVAATILAVGILIGYILGKLF